MTANIHLSIAASHKSLTLLNSPKSRLLLILNFSLLLVILAQVDGEQRGKLLGVLQRLDAVRASGATTVMLAPVLACAPGMLNYLPVIYMAFEMYFQKM